MTLLHPWAIGLGAAAVTLPFVVHWLTKPRPTRMALSTVRFVQQIVQQRRAAYRLRDLLVLLLRAAMVALIAFAFARPLCGDHPAVAADDSADTARVILLDASQSMAATADGTSTFERARSAAGGYLQSRTGLKAALILAGATPQSPLDRLSTNFSALREGLAAAAPRPERLDVAAAINRAAELLAAANPSAKTELVVLSDFQRTNWSAADFSPLPKSTTIRVEPLTRATPANIAILSAGVIGRFEQGRPMTLRVTVGNYSATSRSVQVAATISNTPLRLEGVCPPGVVTTLTSPVTLPTAGWLAGRAELIDAADALPQDNARAFTTHVTPPPTYAFLTAESAKPHASSSHFIERALLARTSPGDSVREQVVRLDPQRPDPTVLAAASAVIVDHAGLLPETTARTLADLMRRGRGVWVVAAESVDATNLQRIAAAAGADLKLPVSFAPATAERRELFLADYRRDQQPFATLGDTAVGLISPLRFAGGLSTQRAEGGLVDDVVATYGDRSAALVVTPCGAGTLAVLNADLGRSNIKSSPAFVPLVSEIAGRLLANRAATDAAPCGERLLAYLPPEAGAAEGLSAVGPDGKAGDFGTFADAGNLTTWQWPAAGPPGVYAVKRGNKSVYTVATAVPADESDPAALDPKLLQTRLAGGRTVELKSIAGDPSQRDTLWPWLLVACAACAAGEMLVLRAFRT